MATKGNNKFPFMLVDPLCGCTGSDGCGRGIEDEETSLPAEPIPAVSPSRNGPVCATDYEPDPTDPIDVELSWHLLSTDHAALAKLMLQRLEPGEYSMDGRHVSIHWGTFGPGPCRSAELLVTEAKEDGDWDSLETPLPIYLRQALDVAASLRGQTSGAPAVARVPVDDRLSFFNLPTVIPDMDPDIERLTSMKRACEEARLREEAVEVYERGYMANGKLAGNEIVVALPRAVSSSLAKESKIPALPKQKGAVTPSSSVGSSLQNSRTRFPGASVPYLKTSGKLLENSVPYRQTSACSVSTSTTVSSSRPMTPAAPPVVARLASGIPASTTRIRKV